MGAEGELKSFTDRTFNNEKQALLFAPLPQPSQLGEPRLLFLINWPVKLPFCI
jgi:hypothetical protein